MTSETWLLAAVATASVILLAVVVSFFAGATTGESRRRHVFVAIAVVLIGCGGGLAMVTAVAAGGARLVSAGLILPLIGIPALGAAILSIPARRLGLPLSTTLVFVLAGTISVVLPVQWGSFAVDGVLQTQFRSVDLAGALPALCAPSVAAITVLSIEHLSHVKLTASTVVATPPIRHVRRRTLVLGTAITVLSWALWIAWMMGMELAVDDVSTRILINGITAPLSSAAAWLVVQQMRHAATTRAAAVTGIISGLAAITPACGYVDAVGAGLIGAIAGAVGSFVAHAVVRRQGRSAWQTPAAIAVGSTIGLLSIGVFSTRLGVAYTGQPELLFSQAGGVVATYAYAALVTAIVWVPVRRIQARPRQPSDPNA